MRGVFITFEGGEGAGKSTQIRHLAQALEAAGQRVLMTREPGGSPLAEVIRAVLLNHEHASDDAKTQALLFAAARRDHCQRTILPALEAGITVLCDRFADSTRAYQGGESGLSTPILETLIALATDGLCPDLTILLDLPPTIGLARAQKRRAGAADTFERTSESFHDHVRTRFLALAKAEPQRFLTLDANEPEETLRLMIAKTVLNRVRSA